MLDRANKYIDENAPWTLAKDMEANGPRLARVLYNLLETIRICAIALEPFMPQTAETILARLGGAACSWDDMCRFGLLPADVAAAAGEALFPRIDLAKELEELDKAAAAAKKAALPAIEVEPLSEELVGKTLVAIVNLPPRKMMGQESCGMLISAVHTERGEEKLHLLMVDDAIPAGAKLC